MAASRTTPAPVDRRTAWKIVLSVVVVVGAVSGLLYASLKEEIQLWKSPDEVALSSSGAAAGEVALDAQADVLQPFGGMGVETTWELQLPQSLTEDRASLVNCAASNRSLISTTSIK